MFNEIHAAGTLALPDPAPASAPLTICNHCGHGIRHGEYPFCPHGFGRGGHLLRAFHPSDRAVVYENPRTGEVRYPATASEPLPQVYAQQGYQRRELDTPQARIEFERRTGKVHERSHYHTGSATAERDLAVGGDIESTHDKTALREKLGAAIDSAGWTPSPVDD